MDPCVPNACLRLFGIQYAVDRISIHEGVLFWTLKRGGWMQVVCVLPTFGWEEVHVLPYGGGCWVDVKASLVCHWISLSLV